MREPRGSGGNPFGDRLQFGRGRPKTNGTNGAHPTGLRTHALSLDEHGAEPVDLVAVQADDELINALAGGLTVAAPTARSYGSDDHITAILAAWKADVDAAPLPELVTVDAGVATVLAGRRRSARARHLAPVAAAAAFLVLAIGGVSVGSYSAQPEDVLWPVSKVLYSERAKSVEAADRAETRISRAKQAIAEGKPDVAAQELQAAAAELAAVRPEEGKIQLADVQDFLVAKAQETPPGVPTDPGSPLVADRTRTVPAGAAIGVEPSTKPVAPAVPPPVVVAPPVSPSSDTGSGAPDPVVPPADPRVLAPVPVPVPAPAPDRDPDPVESPDTSTVPTPDPSPADEGGSPGDDDTPDTSAPEDAPSSSNPPEDSSESSSESMSVAPEETTSASSEPGSDSASPEPAAS